MMHKTSEDWGALMRPVATARLERLYLGEGDSFQDLEDGFRIKVRYCNSLWRPRVGVLIECYRLHNQNPVRAMVVAVGDDLDVTTTLELAQVQAVEMSGVEG